MSISNFTYYLAFSILPDINGIVQQRVFVEEPQNAVIWFRMNAVEAGLGEELIDRVRVLSILTLQVLDGMTSSDHLEEGISILRCELNGEV